MSMSLCVLWHFSPPVVRVFIFCKRCTSEAEVICHNSQCLWPTIPSFWRVSPFFISLWFASVVGNPWFFITLDSYTGVITPRFFWVVSIPHCDPNFSFFFSFFLLLSVHLLLNACSFCSILSGQEPHRTLISRSQKIDHLLCINVVVVLVSAHRACSPPVAYDIQTIMSASQILMFFSRSVTTPLFCCISTQLVQALVISFSPISSNMAFVIFIFMLADWRAEWKTMHISYCK